MGHERRKRKVISSRNLVSRFTSIWLWQPKIPFEVSLMNLRMKFRETLEIASKTNLIVNQYTMKNNEKLILNPIMEKSTQIFTMIKYQKKILNLFVYW